MANLQGRFLRHAETGRWLTPDGGFSHSASAAYNFGTTTAAFDFCRKLKLEGMELVLKFDNSAYEVSIPVPLILQEPGTLD